MKTSLIVLFVIQSLHYVVSNLSLNTTNVELLLDKNESISLSVRDFNFPANLTVVPEIKSIVLITPNQTILDKDANLTLLLMAKSAGRTIVDIDLTSDAISNRIFFHITVLKNYGLEIFSVVIGWVYFIAWSVSFYPQIYSNYKRKSVVGLNFDFLYLNVVGFTLYSIFNLGLYYSHDIKREYFARHPGGLNPVQVNDIVFAVHATFACLITIAQTYLYDRAEQRVSTIARSILCFFAVCLGISAALACSTLIHWLDFLYVCSYVKLTITLIKYIPQAYMNYQRESTVGWSIGNILLDFTGGILSMLQMILNSYNYDDWVSIFGDLTKFGLGLFSVIFDVFFIVQHYILYRHSRYEEK